MSKLNFKINFSNPLSQKEIFVYFAWMQSLIASTGSLYFSEFRHFAPCVLCWYQRIMMYPLVIIIATGILRKDKDLHLYVLPFGIIGMAIALYQVLLERGIIAESITPCLSGVSCTIKYVGYFGFITIPLMSLAAFSIINLCMILYSRGKR